MAKKKTIAVSDPDGGLTEKMQEICRKLNEGREIHPVNTSTALRALIHSAHEYLLNTPVGQKIDLDNIFS